MKRLLFPPPVFLGLALAVAFSSSALAVAATPLPTSTELTITPSPANGISAGTLLTLKATVSSSGVPVTPGMVRFCNAEATYCEDANILGQAQLTTNGTASLNLILPIGEHRVRAQFQGTKSNAASSSSTQNLAVGGKFASASTINSVQTVTTFTLTSTVSSFGQQPLPGGIAFKDNANHQLPLVNVPVGPFDFTFTPPTPYTGSYTVLPFGLFDFNGDGKLDQLAYDYASGNLTILLGNGDGTFTSGTTIFVGTGALAVGDFNNDDILDIAAGSGTASVSILLGKGDGTFSPPTTLSVEQSAEGILVADFNNDGNADLLIGTNAGAEIWFGNGKGEFTFFAPIKLPAGQIVIADLNGDGKPDLILARDYYSYDVYLGYGDGDFDKVNPLPVTCLEGCSTLVIADFNGDGKPDVVVGDIGEYEGSPGGTHVLIGNGDGTFTSSSTIDAGNVIGMTLGDFNGDGKVDFLENNAYGVPNFFLSNGDGTFAWFYPVGLWNSYVWTVGDLNGDGMSDVVVNGPTASALAEWQSSVTANDVALPGSIGIHNVFANYEGDATHATSESLAIPLQGPRAATAVTLEVSPTPVARLQTVRLVATVTPSFVGQDKATGTITFSNGPNALGVVPIVNGRAVFTTAKLPIGTNIALTAYYSGNTEFSSSVSHPVRLTTSGALRPATTTTLRVSPSPTVAQGSVVTLSARVVNAGNPLPVGRVNFYSSTSANSVPTVLGHAQVTPGGFATLRFRPPIGSLGLTAVYKGTNTHAGSASDPVSLTVTGTISTDTTISVIPPTYSADVTADGLIAASGDVNFVDATDSNLVFASAHLGPSSTQFSLTPFQAPYLRVGQNTVAVGDFNGDGILDAATVTSSNELRVLLGNRDGTFTPKFGAGVVVNGAASSAIALEDFNSDGMLDIAVMQAAARQATLTVFLGQGDGTFIKKPTVTLTSASALIADDFNGDGIPDLLTSIQSDGNPVILLGKGDGTFHEAPTPGLGLNVWGSTAVADFNGDGIPDVATLVFGSSGVLLAVLLNNGDGTFVAKTQDLPETVDCNGSVSAAGDVNGDGNQDLILTQCLSMPMMLLGNGNGTFAASTIPAPIVNGSVAFAGDLNADGIPDLILVTGSYYAAMMNVLLGKGDGRFATGPIAQVSSGNLGGTALGDFNGDGTPDILAAIGGSLNMGEWFSSFTQTSQATATDVTLPGTGTQQVYAAYPGDATHSASSSGTAPATGSTLTHPNE